MKLKKRSAMLTMPWKNGQGVTTEIAIFPEGATLQDGFQWRISAAEIRESGPFSKFEGYDRILTVWQGDGLTLQTLTHGHVEMKPLVPHRFRGEDEVTAMLTSSSAAAGASVRDLGVIYRRDRVDAVMSVLPVPAGSAMMISFESEFDTHVLVCVRGSIGIRNASKQNVLAEEGDAVLFETDEGRRVFRGRSSVVLTSAEDAQAVLIALKAL